MPPPIRRSRAALLAAALASLLAVPAAAADVSLAGEWRAVAVGDRALPDEPEVLLAFDALEGCVSGTTGCNRLSGGYALEGDGLTFGPAASTRMACPEPAMAIENAVLAALQATRAVVSEAGRLVLLDGNETAVITLAPADGG